MERTPGIPLEKKDRSEEGDRRLQLVKLIIALSYSVGSYDRYESKVSLFTYSYEERNKYLVNMRKQ